MILKLPWDREQLVSSLAALRLVAENCRTLPRLTGLAELAANEARSLGGDSEGSELDGLVNGPLAKRWASLEIPPAEPFTDRIVFYDGAHIVIGGTVQGAVANARRLIAAVFQDVRPLDPNLAEVVRGVLQLGLSLGDAIASRAGLEPFAVPGRSRQVQVPDAPTLDRLRAAVRWSDAEMGELLASHDIPAERLAELAVSPSPILRTHSGWIVVSPDLLVPTAARLVIDAFAERNLLGELSWRAERAAWIVLEEAMARLGCQAGDTRLAKPDRRRGFREAEFKLDSARSVRVFLIADALTRNDPKKVFGPSLISPRLWSRLSARVADARHELSTGDATDGLVLVVTAPFRALPLLETTTGEEPAPMLSMTVDDLEVISHTEEGEPLALLRFARSLATLRARTHTRAASTLDEFALYRAHGQSFNLGDEPTPSAIEVEPGYALDLRLQESKRRDRRAALDPSGRGFVEITRRYPDASVPIYIPPVRYPSPANIVFIGDVPVWVEGPPIDGLEDSELAATHLGLVEALAYWLWQAGGELSGPVAEIAIRYRRVLIEVILEDGSSWRALTLPSAPVPPESAIDVGGDEIAGVLALVVRPELRGSMALADNRADRALLSTLIFGLRRLAAGADGPDLDESIPEIVNLIAPLGQRRMTIGLDAYGGGEIGPQDVPRWRRVHDHEANRVLDDLGLDLAVAGRLPGRVETLEGQVAFLNQTVTLLYSRLVKELSAFSSEGFLEWLVTQNEAIHRGYALARLLIPPRSECFGRGSPMVQELLVDVHDLGMPGTAVRFLIELVTAQPPTGSVPISEGSYDRMLALAASVIDMATASDAVQFGISSPDVTLLPSWRIRVSDPGYRRAMASYLPGMFEEEVGRAEEHFPDHWRIEPEGDADLPSAMVEEAARSEFGFSLTEFARLLNAAILMADDRETSVVVAPYDETITELVARTATSTKSVREAIMKLSLQQRDDFLVPPSPFLRRDVWPWRFNRPLSFIRRPFLIRDGRRGRELIWGTRHLLRSGAFLADLVYGGRLEARTPQMRRVMGGLARDRGRAFNDAVAREVESVGGLTVHSNVRQIADVPIAINGNPLGDIDVLAVSRREKRLWLLECKAIGLGRNPWELRSELRELFDAGGVIDRVLRRELWMTEHGGQVARWLGLESWPDWQLASMVVVDVDLQSAHLRPSSIPVVPLRELASRMEASALTLNDPVRERRM